MMNVFPRFQFTAQMGFHYVSMFSVLYTVYIDLFVNVFGFIGGLKRKFFILWQQILGKAASRAIFNLALFNSISPYIERLTTCFTKKVLSCFRFWLPILSRLCNCPFSLAIMRTKCSPIASVNEFLVTYWANLHFLSINDND